MSDVDEFIEHYGIKGMRWGKRRTKDISVAERGSKREGRQTKEAKPNAKDLSDEQLRAAVNRMNLEKQYNTLIGNSNKTPARVVTDFIVRTGATAVKGAVTALATKQVSNALQRATTKPKD